ncbi:hypothetical protein EDC55_12810 [Allofrancisella inopinata]|uniref:UPF0125 protein E4K63_04450 n=1 Tax=Allofrancisella inopinata TaxID=1085647 RepID=A0AAE6YHS6_9GAMM|nr:RnfH family protein [Allofrancisella inopinata]QIV96118.1 RnfH family protein [Allofrancisella inopinata]TDT66985.1 hypothetical protein EDC55_12810 [Allofrancisella inopinata]
MKVEVIYPLFNEQRSFFVEFVGNLSVRQAIQKSKILHTYPELEKIEDFKIGIYGEIIDLDAPINDNDRIEIYRELTIDPKKARMLRAEQKRKKEGIKLFGA